uniref:Uncharacterized protein n=1 Tax=Octopus bimaculoides TaxID=37653 RepID=A0A0L8IAI0_OCTBM
MEQTSHSTYLFFSFGFTIIFNQNCCIYNDTNNEVIYNSLHHVAKPEVVVAVKSNLHQLHKGNNQIS